jgi:hypothetical protein
MRDAGQGEPMGIDAAPPDKAVSDNQSEGNARKNMKKGNLNLGISFHFNRILLKSSSREI